MANTAALELTLLTKMADINYYTNQQIYYAEKFQANQAKLQKQVKAEEKWESAFNDAIDNSRDLTANGVNVPKENPNEQLADAYAHAKVGEYNEELSLELAELDIEYDTMKSMYETLLTTMRAEKQSLDQVVQTSAKETGLPEG